MYKVDFYLLHDWEFFVPAIGDEKFWPKGAKHGYPPEIGKWYASEGDYIKAGEYLCQLESGHYMGPKGPNLICPVEGKVLYKTHKHSLRDVCGNVLVSIEVEVKYSSQEIREFQNIIIRDVLGVRGSKSRGFLSRLFG